MTILRTYQHQGYDNIHASWAAGARNVLYVSPTGAGKTTVFAKVINDHPGASVAIAHRHELVSQISVALARNSVKHRVIGPPALMRTCMSLHVGEFRRHYIDLDAPRAVAGVDTLIKANGKDPWFQQVTLWVQDECFPAGTVVDLGHFCRPIDAIRVGDRVTAFDETTGSFSLQYVTRIFRNPIPKKMVRLQSGHHVVNCTLSHPFWTKRGWVNAGNLSERDEVLLLVQQADSENERSAKISLPEDRDNFLFGKSVRDAVSGVEERRFLVARNRQWGKTALLHLWTTGRPLETSGDAIQEDREGLLQSGVLEQISGAAFIRNDEQDQSEVRQRSNESEQPNAAGSNTRQGFSAATGNQAPTKGKGRQRPETSESRSHFGFTALSSWFQNATQHTNGFWSQKRIWLSHLLQTRRGKLGTQDCDRSRRELPRNDQSKETRREERCLPTWQRLDRVEIYEPTDIGRTPGGFVYNLEVGTHHTYVANGFVVHNCHHLLTDNKWGRATTMFPNAKGLGVTATPIRADGRGLGRHADGLMDTMVLAPGMRELIELGYLTDYRIFAPPSDVDVSHVPISASGDFSPEPLRIAVHKSHITGDTVKHYLRIAPGKLGVTFAVDVAAATEQAAAYRQAGVPSEVVSAKTPDVLRAAILKRFAAGEIKQLVNVDLFGEGFDLPAIEVVSMARPTQSFALYSQQFGRSLRPMKGKQHAIIIDHVSNVLRHGLPDAPRVWTLDRRERRSRSKADDIIPVRSCPACTAVYERIYRVCPYCGHYPEPASRSGPEYVDGDLAEMSPEVLARLRGAMDPLIKLPYGATPEIVGALKKHHHEREQMQAALRAAMAQWGGNALARGHTMSQAQRAFYLKYGVDVATAQTLGRADAEALHEKVRGDL